MYVVMKEGKYFTSDVFQPDLASLLWTRRVSDAKVWKQKRIWAQRAADKWGGEVVELTDEGRRPELLRQYQSPPNGA